MAVNTNPETVCEYIGKNNLYPSLTSLSGGNETKVPVDIGKCANKIDWNLLNDFNEGRKITLMRNKRFNDRQRLAWKEENKLLEPVCKGLTDDGKMCGKNRHDPNNPWSYLTDEKKEIDCSSQCQGSLCEPWITELLSNIPSSFIFNDEKFPVVRCQITISEDDEGHMFNKNERLFTITTTDEGKTWVKLGSPRMDIKEAVTQMCDFVHKQLWPFKFYSLKMTLLSSESDATQKLEKLIEKFGQDVVFDKPVSFETDGQFLNGKNNWKMETTSSVSNNLIL
jgi:hypothetical protein